MTIVMLRDHLVEILTRQCHESSRTMQEYALAKYMLECLVEWDRTNEGTQSSTMLYTLFFDASRVYAVGDPIYRDERGCFTNTQTGEIVGRCLHVPCLIRPYLRVQLA